jgi:transcription antitermination protein NusB
VIATMAADDVRWEGRRRAREAALRLLYQIEIGKLTVGDAARYAGIVGGADALELSDDAHAYAVALARGAWDARQTLDGYIADASEHWRVERLAVIDRLLLRLAVHEWLEHPATPPRVVIDEAIELARSYSGDESAKFVNGVLDGVFKRLKEEGKVVD